MQVMTLTAYIQRASLGENDCKSPNDEKRLGRGFWTFCFGFGIR